MIKGKVLVIFFQILLIISCNNKENLYKKNDSLPQIYKNTKPIDEKIHTVKLIKKYEIIGTNQPFFDILASDSSNNLYIIQSATDLVGDSILVINSFGKIFNSFGQKGQGPGEYQNINNLQVLNDTLLLFDNKLCRISKFDKSGKFLDMIKFDRNGASLIFDNKIFIKKEETKFSKGRCDLMIIISIYDRKTNTVKDIWNTKKSFNREYLTSFDNMEILYEIDTKNRLVYIGNPTNDEYKIEAFNYDGIKQAVLNKRYSKLAYNSDEIDKLTQKLGKYSDGIEIHYMKAYNQFFIDKKGRLLVNPNVLRTKSNQNDYYLDVFENGKYLFRTILPEKEQHIFDYDQVKFINDRLYISKAGKKAGDANTLTCYEYEIE